jgi:hypothetical protein
VVAVLPLAAAVGIGLAVLNLFPGASPETATRSPSADPTPGPSAVVRPPVFTPGPTPTPHPANRNAAAWASRDGTLYLAGGAVDGTRRTSSVVLFDGRVWQDLPSLPDERVGAALGALSDGTLVLAGGTLDGTPLDSTLVLEPGAPAWSEGPAMPHAQSHAAYAVLDDRLYLFGGSEAGETDAALAYDHGTSAWFDLAPIPIGGTDAAAAAYGEALYVTGGEGQDGTARSDAFRYDPAVDTWVALAPIPAGTASHTSVVVDGRIWLLGTGSFTETGFGPIPVYDIATDNWTLRDDTNGNASGEGTAALVQPNGDILLIGAFGGGTSTVRTAP